MQAKTTLAVTLLPLLASAATHSVAVGDNGVFTFVPNIVTAAVGDTVDFTFFPKNHSVVASSFADPCVPIQPDGGIFSGFVPTEAQSPDVFRITVNDTRPIWLYCAQGKHCQSGMSMVINEPPAPNTLEAYQAAAKDVVAASTPPSVNGGVFDTAANNATSANGTYPSSTPPGTTGSANPSAAFEGAAVVVKPLAATAMLGLAGMFAGAIFL